MEHCFQPGATGRGRLLVRKISRFQDRCSDASELDLSVGPSAVSNDDRQDSGSGRHVSNLAIDQYW